MSISSRRIPDLCRNSGGYDERKGKLYCEILEGEFCLNG